MNILQICPCWSPSPPRIYGPTEQVVNDLTEALIKRGHDVTLFATGDSKTSGTLAYELPEALTEYNFEARMKHLKAAFAFANSGSFDIIHNHEASRGLHLCLTLNKPHLTTICWTSNKRLKNFIRGLETRNHARLQCVSISHRQREILPYFHWIGTVYNGIQVNSFHFQPKKSNYLLFLGRIAPEKGTDLAIEVARKTGIPLIIAGDFQPRAAAFFENRIQPFLDNQLVHWVGPVDQREKRQLLSKARALLMPIRWEEPFGLVMIEAMASGTPVIAFNKGAVSEIVKHGKTGYIAANITDMVRYMYDIDKLSAYECQRHVETYFSSEIMAEKYSILYADLIQSS